TVIRPTQAELLPELYGSVSVVPGDPGWAAARIGVGGLGDSLWICPGRARRSTRADATRTWMPEKHTLHGDAAGWSSHEAAPGSHAGPAGSVTVSDGNSLGERAPSRLDASWPRTY